MSEEQIIKPVEARGVVLHITPTLRWQERPNVIAEILGHPTKVLQQAWQGDDGSVHWKDVPTVS